jgi:hypothetical protein
VERRGRVVGLAKLQQMTPGLRSQTLRISFAEYILRECLHLKKHLATCTPKAGWPDVQDSQIRSALKPGRNPRAVKPRRVCCSLAGDLAERCVEGRAHRYLRCREAFRGAITRASGARSWKSVRDR